jgi:hypothetical protein
MSWEVLNVESPTVSDLSAAPKCSSCPCNCTCGWFNPEHAPASIAQWGGYNVGERMDPPASLLLNGLAGL